MKLRDIWHQVFDQFGAGVKTVQEVKDLATCGDLKGLARALQKGSEEVRAAAAESLGHHRDAPAAFQALSVALKNDQSESVRAAAFEARMRIQARASATAPVITVGMSTERVIALLGEPTSRSTGAELLGNPKSMFIIGTGAILRREYWLYSVAAGEYWFIIYGGRVAEISKQPRN